MKLDELTPSNGNDGGDDNDHKKNNANWAEPQRTGRISENDQQRNKDHVLQNEEHLFIIAPIVHGFSLTRKAWSK